MTPWGDAPLEYLERQVRSILNIGRTPRMFYVGCRTRLAYDLDGQPGLIVCEGTKVPLVITEDIDETRAVLDYDLRGQAAGRIVLETEAMRKSWSETVTPKVLRGRVTEVRSNASALEHRRCSAMIARLKDRLDREFAGLRVSFSLNHEPDGVWIELSTNGSHERHLCAVNLGQCPNADDYADAEARLLRLMGAPL